MGYRLRQDEKDREKPKISEQAFKEAIEFLGLELKDNGTKCKPWLLARRDGVVYDIYLGLEEKEGKRKREDYLEQLKQAFFSQDRLDGIQEFHIDPKTGFQGELKAMNLDNPFAGASSDEEVYLKLDVLQKA